MANQQQQQKQKALYLEKPNGEFIVLSKEIDKPLHGEILVKVQAVALNPAEWKIAKFNPPFINNYPVVLGADAAGTVEEVGEGVTKFKKGDRV